MAMIHEPTGRALRFIVVAPAFCLSMIAFTLCAVAAGLVTVALALERVVDWSGAAGPR